MTNQTLNNFIKSKADRVWNFWENNQTEPFLDDMNKVGCFADWLDEQSNDDLRDIAGLDYAGDTFISMLRAEMNKGITKFFC